MSWDYTKYEAKCQVCGRTGFYIEGSDDWGRTSERWEGFINEPPSFSPIEVAKKRVDPNCPTPRCFCGSNNIIKGKCLGAC